MSEPTPPAEPSPDVRPIEPDTPPPDVGEPLSLIYLDVDDEITSAASRIRAAAADDVAIVLPYGSRLATSRINFRLLTREAAGRGKRLQLVCAEPAARALAQAAGLPVHASVAAFEAARSGQPPGPPAGGADTSAGAIGAPAGPGPEPDAETATKVFQAPRDRGPRVPLVGPPRPPIRTALAIGLGLALVVLVGVAGYLALELLPAATIVVSPRSEDLGPYELTVQARSDVTTADPATLSVPARPITFDLQVSQTFAATGVKIEEIKATGEVTFSNFDTGASNKVAAGAVVATESGVKFRTLAAVDLPAASIQFPFTIVPSTSTVGVEALVAGPDGNVGNNTITVVPNGANANLLRVTNLEATTGGARNENPQVSQEDVDAATQALAAALVVELDRQVQDGTGVPVGSTLFPETREVGEPSWSVDPASLVGTEAATFDLGASADGTALGVDPSPIRDIALARLTARVTGGWSLVPESVQVELAPPTAIGGVINYPVTIRGTQVHELDAAALLQAVRGLAVAEARAILDDYGDVEISLWPDWVTTIPNRTDRITFTVGEPRPATSPTP